MKNEPPLQISGYGPASALNLPKPHISHPYSKIGKINFVNSSYIKGADSLLNFSVFLNNAKDAFSAWEHKTSILDLYEQVVRKHFLETSF